MDCCKDKLGNKSKVPSKVSIQVLSIKHLNIFIRLTGIYWVEIASQVVGCQWNIQTAVLHIKWITEMCQLRYGEEGIVSAGWNC